MYTMNHFFKSNVVCIGLWTRTGHHGGKWRKEYHCCVLINIMLRLESQLYHNSLGGITIFCHFFQEWIDWVIQDSRSNWRIMPYSPAYANCSVGGLTKYCNNFFSVLVVSSISISLPCHDDLGYSQWQGIRDVRNHRLDKLQETAGQHLLQFLLPSRSAAKSFKRSDCLFYF